MLCSYNDNDSDDRSGGGTKGDGGRGLKSQWRLWLECPWWC